ncbi:phosphodiester glycosidase family protein [Pedobacter sp. SL55]|uniref:phosphodiester glycosidase family protein n=1 Tax=Pedobacter sp. SL55 TaxID=2995161 RepID=UPI00226EF528|nr:phosphodiester glycosidase family protein [Pedobacter sp. SL55]WAC40063.1 phosphodiester glycosidase family protein [Pedobacter sp. SL55]
MRQIKQQHWLLATLFLLFACKHDVVNQPSQQNPVINPVVTEENTIKSVLIKKTTLIGRVVLFQENELVKGVTAIKLAYVDQKDLPMVLFFFKVDLNQKQLVLKPLTPNGSTKYAMQSVPDMINTNTFAGLKIVGAVNSDFFNTTTGEPRSIVYLNGNAVRTILPEIRSYFGLTQSGKPLIGDYSIFAQQKTTIFDALGGYHRLVKQGLPIKQTDVSIHPRTAVGFTATNLVYFLVADGRSPNYANGLTLAQLTEIMTALEVKEAINLDGGGSSTFVVNLPKTEVQNKPSDGSPRKVANGWAICVKN